jgi:hypothetical protein
MPEFHLNMGTEEAELQFSNLDAFARNYITAAFFTDSADELRDATFADLAPETLAKMLQDCVDFEAQTADIRKEMGSRWDAETAGRDFWYTRNGHGCGFWDGDWPEPYAKQLSDTAHAFGEVDLYHSGGDDGKIYA